MPTDGERYFVSMRLIVPSYVVLQLNNIITQKVRPYSNSYFNCKVLKKFSFRKKCNFSKTILYNALYRCPPFVQPPGHKREPRGYKAGQHQKSDNLLVCWANETNNSSTKRLTFHVFFFSYFLIDLGHSKLFIFIFVIL